MQTSVIKKLLHLISPSASRRQKRPSAEISDAAEVSNMNNVAEKNSEAYTVAEATETQAYDSYTEDDEELESEKAQTNASAVLQEKEGNRSHLTSSVPRMAKVPVGAISKAEMAEMREIFGDIDDSEIHRLYKRVTK